MPDEYTKFWTVLNVTKDYDYKRHPSYESASAEAQRLAAKQPGEVFAVMTPSLAFKGEVSINPVLLIQPVETRLPSVTEIAESVLTINPWGDTLKEDDLPF